MSGRGLIRRHGESVCAPTMRSGASARPPSAPGDERAAVDDEAGGGHVRPRLGEPQRLEAGGEQPLGGAVGGVERRRRAVEEVDQVVELGHVVAQRWNSPIGRPLPRRCGVSLTVTIERSPVPAAATRWMLV